MAWDSSKGFWANVGGGIADNTVEKIPGWDSSKGFFDNVAGGTQDVLKQIPKAFSGVGSVAIPLLIIGAAAVLLLRKK